MCVALSISKVYRFAPHDYTESSSLIVNFNPFTTLCEDIIALRQRNPGLVPDGVSGEHLLTDHNFLHWK